MGIDVWVADMDVEPHQKLTVGSVGSLVRYWTAAIWPQSTHQTVGEGENHCMLGIQTPTVLLLNDDDITPLHPPNDIDFPFFLFILFVLGAKSENKISIRGRLSALVYILLVWVTFTHGCIYLYYKWCVKWCINEATFCMNIFTWLCTFIVMVEVQTVSSSFATFKSWDSYGLIFLVWTELFKTFIDPSNPQTFSIMSNIHRFWDI